MLCAISGEAPQVPVASKKSGAVFEKSLIESYIAENGKDPVTNEDLSTEDLVELRASRTVKPRPPQFTSIPSLLSAFQNEWDALALERFKLQQELEQTRKELATALYQNDAAIRVLARIQKERDEARDALSKLSINGGGARAAEDMQVDGQVLPEDLTAVVRRTQADLSKTRRKRPVPEDWATVEDVGSFKVQRLSENAPPSSKFISISADGGRLLHASGQESGTVAVFSVEQAANVESMQSHQDGEISAGVFSAADSVAVGTATGAIGLLDEAGKIDASRIPHSAEVTSVSAHPSGSFFASTSLDQGILFFCLDGAKPTGGVQILSQFKTGAPLTCGDFHPDGHLFAAGGTDGEVKIYLTETGVKAETFKVGGAVQSLAFSENGTWLAVSIKGEAEVQIWHLVKGTAIHRLDAGSPVNCVRWDYTGQFLAAAGSQGIVVFGYSKSAKAWSELLRTPAEAISVAWGSNAKKLYGTDSAGSIFQLGQ